MPLPAQIELAESAAEGTRRPDLRRSVFLPLAGMVALLFLALGLVVLWSEKRSEATKLDREVDSAVRLFELRLSSDVETMEIASEPVISDPVIVEQFLARDRVALLRTLQARFEDLQHRHGISHMYFVGPDRVSFLRVHQPERHGDVIDRTTMLAAQETGEPSHGLELGPLGTLTLRVVVPLRHQGRVVGFFELGREVEHYANDIRDTLSADLHVMIRKDLLDQEQWSQGQAMLGRPSNWHRFDAFVATDAAEDERASSLALDDVMPMISDTTVPRQVTLADGRRLVIAARPLLDVRRREVGLLVVSMDVTDAVHAFRRTMLGFFALFLAFAGAKVLLLHRVVVRAEQGLRRAEVLEAQVKAELEQRVRDRTRELEAQILEREKTESQLRQVQKMEVIGQLTGGVAHDFNNLLAIIMSDLECVRDRQDAELDELIAGAWEATERGASLIARLLAVSRQQPLSPSPIDPNQLIEDLVPLLERAVNRGITIEIDYGPELRCFVDPAQLETLILNLVVNARDAMPEGGTLTIATRNRKVDADAARARGIEAGDYVELSVRDTGTGMAREVLERAFDPFFTTKDVGKGTGLGLSMVHGTARQSGGHVEIESRPGAGTTVTLLLPCSRVEGATIGAQTPAARSVAPA